jgi:hypothetical protein
MLCLDGYFLLFYSNLFLSIRLFPMAYTSLAPFRPFLYSICLSDLLFEDDLVRLRCHSGCDTSLGDSDIRSVSRYTLLV